MTFKTYGVDNQPPETPDINGETNGKVGTTYTYTFVATDSDGDEVYYCIDWGDGTPEVCIGPYASGTEATATHKWTTKGTYIITVKAKDVYNAESDWATLEVTMPRSKTVINFVLLKFLERLVNTFSILKHFI